MGNTVDPDQTPHDVVSNLGLHCLPMVLLRVSKWYYKAITRLTSYVTIKVSLFYSILSHNLRRSSGQHRWICNDPFQPRHVFSCPSWVSKVHSFHSCPFLSSHLFFCLPLLFLSMCPVKLSLLNQKTLNWGQTILVSVSWPGSGIHHILQWLLGSFCGPTHW